MSQFTSNNEEDGLGDPSEELLDEMIEVVDDDDENPELMVDDEEEGDEIAEMEGQLLPDDSISTFSQHRDSVYCIAIHPTDNNLVLSGGCDDKAFLWHFSSTSDSVSWFEVLDGHEDTVTAVSFNFNGKLALTGSYDGRVRVWNIENRPTVQLLQVFDGPEDIEWATFHDKGNGILAGSKDGTVWLWFVQPPQCVNVFAGHDGLVTTGLFVNAGKLICTGGEDGTVRLWNPKTGQCKQVFESRRDIDEIVTCITTEGDIIATGYSSGSVKVYLIGGARLLFSLQHADFSEEANNSSVECVGIYSERLKLLATGGMNNLLIIWDLSTGGKRVECMHSDGVTCLAWHPTSPLILTGCVDSFIRLWDVRDGNQLQTFSGHQNIVLNITLRLLNENTGLIVTGSDDHKIKIHLVDFSRFSR